VDRESSEIIAGIASKEIVGWQRSAQGGVILSETATSLVCSLEREDALATS